MIYSRRKTDKTFFVKNFLKYDYYYFATKNNSLFNEKEKEISFEVFFELFKTLFETKVFVIDEFHSLSEIFLDYLHFNSKGKVILLTSTLWMATNLLEKKDSSLVGIVTPIKFGLIDERDILLQLNEKNLTECELFEASVYLREPILLKYYDGNIKKTVANFLYDQRYYLKNLIGEIFSEEQRQFSRIYEGILRAIANGNQVSGKISSFLFSSKLLDKDNPTLIQKHLEILVNLGLIEKVQVYNNKFFYYSLISPILDLYFYLDVKYGFTEQEMPIEFITEVIEKKYHLILKFF